MSNRTIILSSPNQKIVVTKKTLSDADHTYSRANIEATLLAASVLSDNAFKLYVRMNLHQNDFTYALSPVAIEAAIGMSEGKYRSAVKELIRKGYLVLSPEMKNLFVFYEHPQKDCAESFVEEPNVNTADHVANTEGHGTHSDDHVTETTTSSSKNKQMDIKIQPGNPTVPSTEILQNITGNTTTHNEINTPENTIMDIMEDDMESLSFPTRQDWETLTEKRKREQQLEQERREYEAMISCVDPDDRHFFDHMNPDRDLSFGSEGHTIDWDASDLPF